MFISPFFFSLKEHIGMLGTNHAGQWRYPVNTTDRRDLLQDAFSI